MKNLYVKTVAIVGLFMVLTAGSVAAQTGSMIEVKVPFDFTAGKQELKAGSYTVKRLSREMVLLRSADGKTSTTILATVTIPAGRKDAPERLVFHRYGSRYFLSELWTNRAADGTQLWPSKAEKQLAKQFKSNGGPEKVEVVARAK